MSFLAIAYSLGFSENTILDTGIPQNYDVADFFCKLINIIAKINNFFNSEISGKDEVSCVKGNTL